MELINASGCNAKFLAGSPGDREMVGIVGSKVTYRFGSGRLVPAGPDESWPIFDGPNVFQDVKLGPDLEMRRTGVDVVVFGNAVAAGKDAATYVRVSVECGLLSHRVVVFGDRTWQRAPGGLVASIPEAFVEMPLTNDRAFGGTSSLDGLDLAHSVNPQGRGFYLSEEEAEGSPLPNIELEENLVRAWNDDPPPACLYRPEGWLDDPRRPDNDPQNLPFRMMESGFGHAVPQLTARPEDLGDVIRLEGFSKKGVMEIPMPPKAGPRARVTVGALESVFGSTISTIVVLTEPEVLVVGYLCLFRYLFRPEERRTVELTWPEGGLVSRAETGVKQHV